MWDLSDIPYFLGRLDELSGYTKKVEVPLTYYKRLFEGFDRALRSYKPLLLYKKLERLKVPEHKLLINIEGFSLPNKIQAFADFDMPRRGRYTLLPPVAVDISVLSKQTGKYLTEFIRDVRKSNLMSPVAKRRRRILTIAIPLALLSGAGLAFLLHRRPVKTSSVSDENKRYPNAIWYSLGGMGLSIPFLVAPSVLERKMYPILKSISPAAEELARLGADFESLLDVGKVIDVKYKKPNILELAKVVLTGARPGSHPWNVLNEAKRYGELMSRVMKQPVGRELTSEISRDIARSMIVHSSLYRSVEAGKELIDFISRRRARIESLIEPLKLNLSKLYRLGKIYNISRKLQPIAAGLLLTSLPFLGYGITASIMRRKHSE